MASHYLSTPLTRPPLGQRISSSDALFFCYTADSEQWKNPLKCLRSPDSQFAEKNASPVQSCTFMEQNPGRHSSYYHASPHYRDHCHCKSTSDVIGCHTTSPVCEPPPTKRLIHCVTPQLLTAPASPPTSPQLVKFGEIIFHPLGTPSSGTTPARSSVDSPIASLSVAHDIATRPTRHISPIHYPSRSGQATNTGLSLDTSPIVIYEEVKT